MLIYHNTFEDTRTVNSNYPVEDQYYASDYEAIVADGITRDPIGVSDLSLQSFSEMLKKYPRPSGAELAAKEIVSTFQKERGSLKERLIACNDAVKTLNEKYIRTCDYLQNDYFGAVASCIRIENDILHYAYICDCGVIVYDTLGNVKFQTEDDKAIYSDPYINQIGIPWNLPEARVIVRRDYRNNLNCIRDGKCVSYGALTGEDSAVAFIKEGKVKLNPNDTIVVYSDGFSNYLDDTEFINYVLHFDASTFEAYIHQQSQFNQSKYGKEKTIIIYKN